MSERTHCIHGHDLRVVGVRPSGDCRQCHSEAAARYRAKHREEARARTAKWRQDYPERVKQLNRDSYAKSGYKQRAALREARRQALLAYGDGSCARCGERPDDIFALELDHVEGDGAVHRQKLGGSSSAVSTSYVKLRKLGWPNDPPLQTLCHECHRKKHAAMRRAYAARARAIQAAKRAASAA